MIRKGIRITPENGGVKFEAHKVDTLDMIMALAAIAHNLNNTGVDKADILKAAEAGADGSAFARIKY